MTARLPAARHQLVRPAACRAAGTVRRLRAAGTARGSGRRATSSSRKSILARSLSIPSGSFRCSISFSEVGVTGTSESGSPCTDAASTSGKLVDVVA